MNHVWLEVFQCRLEGERGKPNRKLHKGQSECANHFETKMPLVGGSRSNDDDLVASIFQSFNNSKD